MSEYHIKRAKEIVQSIIYATIATASKDGKPWNSPVRHCFDKDMNIYWFSDKENQHSKNVRKNEDIFIVIYNSTVPEGQGEGVYFEAKAVELNDPEEIRLARRIKNGPDKDAPDDFMGNAIRRVYKATPVKAWMNDSDEKDGIFLRDYRIEIPLEEFKNLKTP
ncbi:MAG: pyridoxamine 5'-phosphate oxidase family protein [Minisyncoccia bacterium]